MIMYNCMYISSSNYKIDYIYIYILWNGYKIDYLQMDYTIDYIHSQMAIQFTMHIQVSIQLTIYVLSNLTIQFNAAAAAAAECLYIKGWWYRIFNYIQLAANDYTACHWLLTWSNDNTID